MEDYKIISWKEGWKDYWKIFDEFIELLKIDNQSQIVIDLKDAQLYVNGMTDGWYEFKFAFEKVLSSNKSRMTSKQLDIADILISTLDKIFVEPVSLKFSFFSIT